MKRILSTVLGLFLLLGAARTANAAPSCSQVAIESPGGIRALYFMALCGSQTSEVLATVSSGEGRVFALAPDLAAALDIVTPLMHRVDYVYVRGGGAHKPTVVIPFTNGVDALLFKSNARWTQEGAESLAYYWNRAPYEFMRRASVKLNDAVLMEGKNLSIGINIFGLYVPIATLRGALAYPFGFVMYTEHHVAGMRSDQAGDMSGSTYRGYYGAGGAIHELAHYNHYYAEGLTPFAFTGDFGSISRRNCTIFWVVPVPFCFKDRDGVSNASYVSDYAHNGEMRVLEDYADTLSTAIGVTQEFRKSAQFASMYPSGNLFANSDPFAKQKAAFMTSHFTYSPAGPMDADLDGVPFVPGATGDCSDINPASTGTCGQTGVDGGSSSDAGGDADASSPAGELIAGPCSHDVCSAGERQGQACNACTMQVCAHDPYCCDTYWGNSCFAAVQTYCGKTCE